MEDEDDDPVGALPVHDPVARFTELAVAAGVIRPGDPLDQNLVDYARGVAELCATIADPFGDPEAGGNGGEAIRAVLLG